MGEKCLWLGNGVGHHRDVQKHLSGQQRHDTHYQQRAEPVPGVDGDPESPDDEQRKGRGSHRPTRPSSSQTTRKMKSFSGSGRKSNFCRLPQAHTQQAAGADGEQDWMIWKPSLVRSCRRSRVSPDLDTGGLIAAHHQQEQPGQAGRAAHKPVELDSRRKRALLRRPA